jgi:hypothetical protein
MSHPIWKDEQLQVEITHRYRAHRLLSLNARDVDGFTDRLAYFSVWTLRLCICFIALLYSYYDID